LWNVGRHSILGNMAQADLEGRFLEIALRRSSDLKGNVTRANRAYAELHDLKNQMRLLPDRGEAMLKRLAAHANIDVRMIACAALLAVDEPFALDALQQIARSEPGFASLTAEMTIREWRAGRLKDHWN